MYVRSARPYRIRTLKVTYFFIVSVFYVYSARLHRIYILQVYIYIHIHLTLEAVVGPQEGGVAHVVAHEGVEEGVRNRSVHEEHHQQGHRDVAVPDDGQNGLLLLPFLQTLRRRRCGGRSRRRHLRIIIPR